MENKKDKNLKILLIIMTITIVLLIGTVVKMYSILVDINENSGAIEIDESTNSNEEVIEENELEIESDRDSESVEPQVEYNIEEILGKWRYYSIQENGEEISFRDVFGSGIQNNMGSMTFYKNGTFTNYLPGISSSEIEDKGTFKFDGKTITLIYSNKTENITYYKETGTLEQQFSDYVLTLVRAED